MLGHQWLAAEETQRSQQGLVCLVQCNGHISHFSALIPWPFGGHVLRFRFCDAVSALREPRTDLNSVFQISDVCSLG